MAQIQIPSEIPVRYLRRSKGGGLFLLVLTLVGLAAFFITLMRDPAQAWRAYVVNWLFFTSIAAGAMALMAATTITRARWNWSVRRVGLAFVAFLPVSFLLLLPMLGLREGYFPWIEAMAYDPIVQKKAAYLNIPFLITRNAVGAALLFGLFIYMAYLYLRPDLGRLVEEGRAGDGNRGSWAERLSQGWMGREKEEARSWRRLGRLAPVSVLLYAAVMSVFSFDWAMSLEPHWFSTLFGAWFFMGALWGGVAAMAWATVFVKGRDPDLNKLMGPQQLHDLGKLSFAFTVFWAYLFFSQYLVIWYGKLPWEQAWVIHRAEAPWGGALGADLRSLFRDPLRRAAEDEGQGHPLVPSPLHHGHPGGALDGEVPHGGALHPPRGAHHHGLRAGHRTPLPGALPLERPVVPYHLPGGTGLAAGSRTRVHGG